LVVNSSIGEASGGNTRLLNNKTATNPCGREAYRRSGKAIKKPQGCALLRLDGKLKP
jgi:hypothetical protein